MTPPPVRFAWSPYSLAAAERLAGTFGLSPVAAAILVRRGYGDEADARRFLAADERHDPLGLAGMEEACALVLAHVRRGSRIVVHGDYDVDGVCSTAVLVRTLRALGAAPDWHLPSRFDEGYGLSAGTVARLAGEAGLLVAVDCGITAVAEIEQAKALGLDVVVCDHHRPAERLPPCPIVHPVVGEYACRDLCATGVAHKMSEALFTAAGLDPGLAQADLDLVALATVADVVPLRGENRRLVREGLEALARTGKPGLRALMRVASVDRGALSTQVASFRMAPRMNAAGRLGRADAALELVLTDDSERAQAVAEELDELNRERRDAETRTLFGAEAERGRHADASAFVLAGEGWHPGVIGIVASRLVERHHRPCVLIALDGARGTGSGRSIEAFDLHGGLAACAMHLRRFGGHRAAAGLEIDVDQVDAFRRAFVDHAARTLAPDDLVAECRVDALVGGDALGMPLAEELARLGPFGHGNPEPTLLVPAARVAGARGMGEDDQHASFVLENGGARARGVAFRTSAASLASGEPHDVAVRLEARQFAGVMEARPVMQVLRPTEPGRCRVLGEELSFWPALAAELDRAAASPDRSPDGRGAHGADRPGSRIVRDRRGFGVAGIIGDLLSTGETVLVVCADAARRRPVLEARVAALLAPEHEEHALGLVSWPVLRRHPELAHGFHHVVALDPPASTTDQALLEHASGPPEGFVHLLWGPAEVAFTDAVLAASLDLRPVLAEVFRVLRDAGGRLTAAPLAAALEGAGETARSALVVARVVRVFTELGLVGFEPHEGGAWTATLLSSAPTSLERSRSHRAFMQELAEARRHLARVLPRGASRTPARMATSA